MRVHRIAEAGFGAAPEAYERGRPSYPQPAVDLLCAELGIAPGRDVLDLAAGTGKLTRQLVPTGARLVAVEPVEGMRGVLEQVMPDLRLIDGTAEDIPLPDNSIDAVVVGQAFHWFDAPAALQEIARVLRAGGGLGMLWNVRDDDSDWVSDVTRLLEPYAGDIPRNHDLAWRPALEDSAEFGPLHERRFRQEDHSTLAAQRDRFSSISFVACLPQPDRDALLDEIYALVAPHAAADGTLTVPYRTDAYWSRRR
jgi:SAM-dependent methyltransferase